MAKDGEEVGRRISQPKLRDMRVRSGSASTESKIIDRLLESLGIAAYSECIRTLDAVTEKLNQVLHIFHIVCICKGEDLVLMKAI